MAEEKSTSEFKQSYAEQDERQKRKKKDRVTRELAVSKSNGEEGGEEKVHG